MRQYPDSLRSTALDSRMAHPSRTIMFADAAMPQGDHITEYGLISPPFGVTPQNPTGDPNHPEWPAWQSTPSMHFRHNGRVNVVWSDGSVTSEPWGWSHTKLNIFDGDNHRWGVGWFGPRDNRLFYPGPKVEAAHALE